MNDILNIGLVIADENEYSPLFDVFSDCEITEVLFGKLKANSIKMQVNGKTVVINAIRSGCGNVNAAVAASHLCENNDIIINFGFAGSIFNYKVGDVILGTCYLEHDFDISALGYEIAEKPNQEYVYFANKKLLDVFKDVYKEAKECKIASGDSFVSEDATKDFLKNELLCGACDMEAAAVAYAAYTYNKPFLSYKLISDGADEDATETYKESYDNKSDKLCVILRNLTEKLSKENFDF